MKNGVPCSLVPLLLFFFFFFFFFPLCCNSQNSATPNTSGYTCTPNQTINSCETYAFYRATAPNFLDLASIADLFSLSRLMISEPNNISSPSSPLLPNESVFVPIKCSCNTINVTYSISYANITYKILKGDNFYLVSTNNFQNLTTYQSVEVVNPTLVPTDLPIGVDVIFPIFCKCPNRTQLGNQSSFLISYVFQPNDTLPSVAAKFGSNRQSIIDVNGNNIQPFDTVFVPVSGLPNVTQPVVPPVSSPVSPPVSVKRNERKGKVIGLSIGLGICGLLLFLVVGLWKYREGGSVKERGVMNKDEEKQHQSSKKGKVGVNLMADVSDCLDKYRVFGIEELVEATDGFDAKCMIHGSVYKGCISGELYAIKKMKWNACEELKILQKVNHGNLVKLEGFCIDPEDANCYLIYEYIENGSLHSWLHDKHNKQLNWKTRLRIAVDVANGLQYIHEHTRPQVVHKDIKSSNILLDANMRAKIANFGLAKSGCNAITMHIVGTKGYIAPEYLTDGVVSTKMDVFSFGVLLLELVSGREAINEEGKVLWSTIDGILEGREEKNLERLQYWMDDILVEESCPMESVVNVMSVAIACLHKNPTRRPTMVDIVYALSKSDDYVFDISEDGISPRQVIGR